MNLKTSSSPTVFLGMSGGVDSSLSAVLLKERGYNVVGVYMKNWSKDLPGMKCPWAEDLADAKRVAVKLGIDFRVFDFETEYKQKVVDYMLAEFKKGRTPNPDIMCNEEIKFKLFYEGSREQGADFIATGHYARIGKLASEPNTPQPTQKFETVKYLKTAVDENKDQTYFLYRISEDAIAHTIFPIGHLTKPEVKKLAEQKGLANAYKKESMGVCFVGDVGMDDFLREYFEETPGPIIDVDSGEELGTHEGAIFYTIGQRHGLDLGGGLPYYVVKKDIDKNIIYVSRNLNNDNLWTTTLDLEDVVARCTVRGGKNISVSEHARLARRAASSPREDGSEHRGFASANVFAPLNRAITVRLRHRAPLIPAKLILSENNTATLIFEKPIKRPAAGQSAVFYSGDNCFGGGIIKA
ncbi:tRNA 2-thiouridine(34) synthase MnmA [Candidatus Saccharibacteria bacterium]|nr:tRNA 2-thiouridine(34) synthase MnmA [Candidatus Saccharibacteria bacterium]